MENREFHQLIKDTEKRLRNAGIESAAAEVEIILETLLDVERIDVYLHGARLIDTTTLKKFYKIVERRTSRYPLQYILGEAYFYGRKFLVNPDVMIPTPETELLCELALNYIKNEGIEYPEILDIGTGSGVIAVTMACELKESWITATDICQPMLHAARKNAAMHEVESQITFIKSNLFTGIPLEGKFDLILSNPAYIAEGEYSSLAPEVLADPKISLVSGMEGLDMIKELIDQAPDYLKLNGRLMFEIGYDQDRKIARISEKDNRYRSFSVIKDLNDINRVVILSV